MKLPCVLLLLFAVKPASFAAPDANAMEMIQSWEYRRWEGSGNCSANPCGWRQFCGTNNMCYQYSCGKWYRYGPPEFTGHHGTAPVELDFIEEEEIYTGDYSFPRIEDNAVADLSCENIPVPDDITQVGVMFDCFGPQHGNMNSPPPDSINGMILHQGFTRRCSALNVNTHYVCYEISPDTDFEALRRNSEIVHSNKMLHCSPDLPNFMYGTYLYGTYLNGSLGIVGILSSSIGSNETYYPFDESLARTTLYSYLGEVDDDNTDDDGSVDNTDNDDSDGAAMGITLFPFLITVGAILFM